MPPPTKACLRASESIENERAGEWRSLVAHLLWEHGNPLTPPNAEIHNSLYNPQNC